MLMSLAARSGQPNFVLYPASPREECQKVFSQYNHDSYFIDGEDKIPLQAKSNVIGETLQKIHESKKQHTYADSILVFSTHTLVRSINKRFKRLTAKPNSEVQDQSPDFIALLDLIIDESRGDELYGAEKSILDAATQSLIGAKFRHARRLELVS